LKSAESKCADCLITKYCDKKCQLQDWTSHQKICNGVKRKRDEKELVKELFEKMRAVQKAIVAKFPENVLQAQFKNLMDFFTDNVEPVENYEETVLNATIPNISKNFLTYAIQNRNEQLVQFLINRGVFRSEKWREQSYDIRDTPLELAAIVAEKKIFFPLLQAREWSDSELKSALAESIHMGNRYEERFSAEILRALITAIPNFGVDSELDDENLLFMAKSVEVLEFLLVEGAVPNVVNKYGWSRLIQATMDNEEEIIEILLAHDNIDANLQDEEGRGPLHWAVIDSRDTKRDTMALLLASEKIDVNLQNEDGKTPLHFAVKYDLYRRAEMLLERGADVGQEDDDGTTAIYYTMERDMEKLLLKYGAD